MRNDPYTPALIWLLRDKVQHGDVHQSKKAQEHLDAIAEHQYPEGPISPPRNALKELPSAEEPPVSA